MTFIEQIKAKNLEARKAKCSVAQKKVWADEETRAKRLISIQGVQQRPEVKAKQAEAKYKPCTIDGTTIFGSVSELVRTLGQGKNGLKHPNFKYIERTA